MPSPAAPLKKVYTAQGQSRATGPYFDMFVLIANPGDQDALVHVSFLLPNGNVVPKSYVVAANSRFNIVPYSDFPDSRGKRFGMVVESLGGQPAQIVVERAMYSDAQGVRWAAGTNALATKLQ